MRARCAGPDGIYPAARVKDGGSAWYEYTGMSGSGYQKRFDELKAKGFLPSKLDVEGTYVAVRTKR
ncbi:hypothetical protein OHA77_16685 [Streptosporangium sp. NBC_01639]|uniref:hypothetical protein n=1 Tax=Streptosporangium sp. NBC_01639 TaxID=2975948 RepID=UPI00386B63DC|nr:hypothetical protein OHA77_16685 [Streptosporangium sp. NBC_01639]